MQDSTGKSGMAKKHSSRSRHHRASKRSKTMMSGDSAGMAKKPS